jgi:type I restriction enzyme R subunit
LELAERSKALSVRFPNAKVNADERRKLRAALYLPLLALNKDERGRVVDVVLAILLDGNANAEG